MRRLHSKYTVKRFIYYVTGLKWRWRSSTEARESNTPLSFVVKFGPISPDFRKHTVKSFICCITVSFLAEKNTF